MSNRSTEPGERGPGEAWIDSIDAMLSAQKDFYINSLRWWQRMTWGAFARQADAMETVVEGAADAAASASKAAEARGESLGRTLTEQTRRTRIQPDGSAVFDALTIEQLDRLADANNIDEYPHSGTKRDKIDALATAGLSLEALPVDYLDRLAANNGIEDYPKSAPKSEKVAALAAAGMSL